MHEDHSRIIEGAAQMEFGATKVTTPGIKFPATFAAGGSSGTFQWVQLITGDKIELLEPASPANNNIAGPRSCYVIPIGGGLSSPAPSPKNPFLDTVYPYATGVLVSDTPGLTLSSFPTFGEASTTIFTATMYLMWDPTIPPAGQNSCKAASVTDNPDGTSTGYPSTCASIPVTLGSISWAWQGCSVNTFTNQPNKTQWTLACSSGNPTSQFAAAGYPQWQLTRPSSGLSGTWQQLLCVRE